MRVAEAAEQALDLARLFGAGLTDLPGDGGTGPCEELLPVFGAEFLLRRVPQQAKVVEHELLGAGIHAPIIPQRTAPCRRTGRTGLTRA
ncbi:MAG: hypothetical protein ACRDNF_25320 [Streptosporangiaceae bacterium]